ncbi:hypothetical protein ACFLXF_03530 [Chloroflexota bacterium]
MELDPTVTNILLGVLIFGLLIFNIYAKKRKSDKSPIGMAAGIFSDVNKNLKLLENFSFHWRIGKLKSGNWQRNKNKIDFLPVELRSTLSKTFDLVGEVNQRVEAAQKYKSDSYMAGIDIDKLKEPLTWSKERLQEWIQDNYQNPEYMPKKRRGLFG